MGVSDQINDPIHHRADPSTGEHVGWMWFYGSDSLGHLGPANNPATSTATTNAIIAGARVSESAMLAAMPSWLASWYSLMPSGRRAAYYHQVKHHPDVQLPPQL